MDGLLQNMKGFLGGYLSNEDKHNLSKNTYVRQYAT